MATHPPPPPPSTPASAADYPLKSISQPHPHDVLCGRGGGTNQHIGNSHWRMLVQDNKALYVTLPKRQKMLLSQSIVKAVRSQNPPGRFLQKDPHTELWYDVGDQRATEKTSQALREGAPDIRNKIVAPPASSSGAAATPGMSAPRSPAKSYKAAAGAAVVAPPSAFVAPTPLPPQPVAPPPIPVPQLAAGLAPNGVAAVVAAPPPHIPPPVQPQGPVPDRRKRKDKKAAATADGAGSSIGGTSSTATPSTSLSTSSASLPPTMPVSADECFPDSSSQVDPVVEPPAPLDSDQAFSLGSIAMTDAEQAQLMNGCSIGSSYDFHPPPPNAADGRHHPSLQASYLPSAAPPPHHHPHYDAPYYRTRDSYDEQQDDPYEPEPLSTGHSPGPEAPPPPLPVDGGLEPAGFSLGSVMSTGTTLTDVLDLQNSVMMRLEPAGLSVGSMMSYVRETHAPAPAAERPRHGSGGLPMPPDAGLEAIGTSFGSLSLATDYDYQPSAPPLPQPAQNSYQAAPTFLQQQRSTANLLDCSDSDDEQDTSTSAQRSYLGGGTGSASGAATGLSPSKSTDYEKLRATLESQNYAALPTSTTSRAASAASHRSAAASRTLMPPPAPVVQWNANASSDHQQYAQPSASPAAAAPPQHFHQHSVVPITNFQRDFSQMSALSVDGDDDGGYGADDFDAMPPPPPMVKQHDDNSEWERTDYLYYNR